MNTKERILQNALQLFNERGINPVTTRHIAAALSISHGNLCYHFASREIIIEQLYHRLVAELDAEIGQATQSAAGLPELLGLTQKTFEIQYKYRFILLHIVEIMRKITSVGAHFRQLLIHRKVQFSAIIGRLVREGIFETESYPGQYDRLVTQFYLIGDFWLSEAEILYEGPEEEKVNYYVQIARSLIFPYLTDKGKEAFGQLPASFIGD